MLRTDTEGNLDLYQQQSAKSMQHLTKTRYSTCTGRCKVKGTLTLTSTSVLVRWRALSLWQVQVYWVGAALLQKMQLCPVMILQLCSCSRDRSIWHCNTSSNPAWNINIGLPGTSTPAPRGSGTPAPRLLESCSHLLPTHALALQNSRLSLPHVVTQLSTTGSVCRSLQLVSVLCTWLCSLTAVGRELHHWSHPHVAPKPQLNDFCLFVLLLQHEWSSFYIHAHKKKCLFPLPEHISSSPSVWSADKGRLTIEANMKDTHWNHAKRPQSMGHHGDECVHNWYLRQNGIVVGEEGGRQDETHCMTSVHQLTHRRLAVSWRQCTRLTWHDGSVATPEAHPGNTSHNSSVMTLVL